MRHPHFYELRFLLHGSLEHYDRNDDLFIADDSKELWKIVADCVLEPWQVLSPNLVSSIYALKDQLHIKKLEQEEIIRLLETDSCIDIKVTAEKFTDSQIIDLLNQIYRIGKSKESLWKKLKLHKTLEGYYVSITDTTYLESNDSIPNILQNSITLVQKNSELDQNWIDPWTSQIAIDHLLSLAGKQNVGLELLNLLKDAISSQQKQRLKETRWVRYQQSLNPNCSIYLAPSKIIILKTEIRKLVSSHLVTELNIHGYYSISQLDSPYSKSSDFQKLCLQWSYKELLEFLLSIENSFVYADSILKILLKIQESDLDDKCRNLIKQKKTWIPLKDSGTPISLNYILYHKILSNDQLSKPIIDQIVDYLDDYYRSEDCEIDISSLYKSHKFLFINDRESLKILANGLSQIPELHIGHFNLELDLLLNVLSSVPDMSVLQIAKVNRQIFEEYFLKPILQKIDAERVIKIINSIISSDCKYDEKAQVINHYLSQYDSAEQKLILSSIQLLNQRNQWKPTDQLCNPEKVENISEVYLLNLKYHRPILDYLESQDKSPSNVILKQPAVRSGPKTVTTKNKAKRLQQYFGSWNIQGDIIGIFIWLLAGEDKKTQELAHDRYLSCDRSTIANIFNPESYMFNGQITIEDQTTETFEVQNILGYTFKAQRSSSNVNSIFAGSFSHDKLPLVSLNFENIDSNTLESILKKSITLLCKEVFNTNIKDDDWTKIESLWQIYPDVAESMIIQDCRTILKQLRINNKYLSEKIDTWNDLYREDLEAQHFQQLNNKQKIEQQINQIEKEIHDLVRHNESVQQSIYEAVRDRIRTNGYALSSILLELFQNADDATLEYEQMLGTLEMERSQFYIWWNENEINVYHSGRPINCLTHPKAQGNYQPRKQFKYDLFNMLSFHSSDKSEHETGKFGLGFKSIYLACSEPIVISDKLQFSIQGGLIPVSKSSSDSQIEKLRQEKMPHPDGTLIHLKIQPKVSVHKITQGFNKLISLILVFSKVIKSCKLEHTLSSQTQSQDLDWSSTSLTHSQRLQVGTVKLQDNQTWKPYKLLCFNMKKGNLAIIIPKDLKKSPLEGYPTFWVTAPTKEELNLRFVINAKFSLTTGRTSLDRNAIVENCNLARELGLELFEGLEELYQELDNSKDQLLEKLGIPHHKASQFWEFLWDVLVIDWTKKLNETTVSNNNLDLSIQIINTMIAQEDTGLGKLIQIYPVLPSGISSNPLVCLKDIKFYFSSFISHHSQILRKILDNNNFCKGYPNHKIISNTTKSYLDHLFGKKQYKEIRYSDVLLCFIQNKRLSSAIAQEIYEIFSAKIVVEVQSKSKQEYETCKSKFQNLEFDNMSNGFQVGSDLYTNESSSREEKLRMQFAPDQYILSSNYRAHQGLECFLAYRKLLGITLPDHKIQDIVRWCLEAKTKDKQQGVIDYLWERGDFYKELASRLLNYIRNPSSLFWGKSDDRLRKVINDIILSDQPIPDSEPVSPQSSYLQPASPPPIDSASYLEKIYEWWSKNRVELIKEYENKVYPDISIGSKISIKDTDINEISKQRWMILFMLGMFHTMGRQQASQHRTFLEHCDRFGWIKTFTEEPSEYWMEILDIYFTNPDWHRNDEVLEYYQWLKNYPGVFALSKWFDVYQQSFLELNKLKSSSWAFRPYLRPKTNPHFRGSGLDNQTPPIDKILGIGSNFILRELIRLRVINNQYTHSYAYVPTGQFRGFLRLIGCDLPKENLIESSRQIYSFIKENLGKDKASFMNDFDIPFLILLSKQNDYLRQQILGKNLCIESPSDEYTVSWPSVSQPGEWRTLRDGRRVPIS